MGSLMVLACTQLLQLIVVSATTFMEFQVGDADGWRQPGIGESKMYTRWASNLTFHVGDSLRFEYTNDSVVAVDKKRYHRCSTNNSTSVFYDGNTVVNLSKPGPAYFISGNSDHCEAGQRLAVKVVIHDHHHHIRPVFDSPPPHQPSTHMPPSPSPLSSSDSSVSDSLLLLQRIMIITASAACLLI